MDPERAVVGTSVSNGVDKTYVRGLMEANPLSEADLVRPGKLKPITSR